MALKRTKGSGAVRDLAVRQVPLPSNLEAEEATIGCFLFDPAAIYQAIDLLVPADYFGPANEAIYTAMVSLARPREGEPIPITPVTVSEALENLGLAGHLTAYGGIAHLFALARKAGTADNVLAHVAIVRKYSRARAVMAKGMTLYTGAGEAEDFDTWLRDTHGELGELAFVDDGKEPVLIRAALNSMVKDVEERYQTRTTRSPVSGVSTGITRLDEKTGGLQNEFILIAARPSMGKSAFMCHLAGAASEARIPSLTFSLEMSIQKLVERMAAQQARVKTEDLKNATLETRDWIALTKALSAMSEWPCYIDDTPQTINTLRDKARRWRRRFSQKQCPVCANLVRAEEEHCGGILRAPGVPGCGAARPRAGWPLRKAIVFLDYLGRIPVKVRPGGSDEKALADLSRQLKDLPAELQCPVVVLTQLNRKCEERKDKRPMKSDLRDSGALEQDADVILFLYRDEVYVEDSPDKGIVEIIIGKQRNGPTGTVKAVYLDTYGPRFENLSTREAP